MVEKSSGVSGRLRLAVLMGGRSSEREVSLDTGRQVADALRGRGHGVLEIDPRRPSFIDELASTAPDSVFVCLHGRYGEDGTVQGLLELLDLPYVGSGVLSSALAMDKAMSKIVYEAAGIPTPASATVEALTALDASALAAELGEHVVVKPSGEGSAIGVTIVERAEDLAAAVAEALLHGDTALVERYVRGAEVTVGVLGNEDPFALPTLQVIPEHHFYDYESKYVPGMSRHLVPALISTEAQEECTRLALAAHLALRCRGVSRTDLIVTEDGQPWVLETNTIPGMTKTSLLPEAAAAAGIPFDELCEMLVRYSLEVR